MAVNGRKGRLRERQGSKGIQMCNVREKIGQPFSPRINNMAIINVPIYINQ